MGLGWRLRVTPLWPDGAGVMHSPRVPKPRNTSARRVGRSSPCIGVGSWSTRWQLRKSPSKCARWCRAGVIRRMCLLVVGGAAEEFVRMCRRLAGSHRAECCRSTSAMRGAASPLLRCRQVVGGAGAALVHQGDMSLPARLSKHRIYSCFLSASRFTSCLPLGRCWPHFSRVPRVALAPWMAWHPMRRSCMESRIRWTPCACVHNDVSTTTSP